MFFPIGDDHIKGKYTPFVTYILIAINCYVFWQQITLPEKELNQLIYTYGAIPKYIMKGERLLTLVTSLFLHGGWMHLIGNMMFLWIFGDNIEVTVGNLRFALFYILGGIFGAAVHSYLYAGSDIPCIGASGAISAALGAYLILYPSSKIKILFFIFVFRVSAFAFLGLWIVQQLIGGWAAIGPRTSNIAGIGYWAHIGGFAYGFVFGLIILMSSRKKRTRSLDSYY